MKARFTLMEMLMVIIIIGILSAILVPAVLGVKERSTVSAVKSEIMQLVSSLEAYQGQFGDYPPSTLKELGQVGNLINEGNESLVQCLSTEIHGPFFQFQDGFLGNNDGDTLKKNLTKSTFIKRDLFEWHDRWGNPYVYIHYRDFKPNASFQYQVGESYEIVACIPQKSTVTGNYHGHLKFQLWSVGPNGLNENGGGDDIVSWDVQKN